MADNHDEYGLASIKGVKLPQGITEDDYYRLTMNIDTSITVDQVILSPENRVKVEEFLDERTYKNKFIKHGLEPISSLLFYGASGCGKTTLGRALCNYLEYKMLYIDVNALAAKDVADNIKKIFRIANTGRYLVFLDECDSIGWDRDDADTPESGDRRRATNSVFQQMDQMNLDTIVVAATNMYHRLDDAFKRRFQIHFEFTAPKVNAREAVSFFIANYPAFKLEIDVIDEQMERRSKLSFFTFEDLLRREIKRCIIHDSYTVKMSNIYSAMGRAMNIGEVLRTAKD